jgi:hypothetical protein
MLQRIQTLFFLLAFVLVTLPLARIELIGSGSGKDTYSVNAFEAISNIPAFSGHSKFYFLGCVLSMISIIITTFMFKNRKRQMLFAWVSIACVSLTIGWVYVSEYLTIASCTQCKINSVSPGLGLILMVVAIPLLFFGRMRVKKDQQLIDSLNRLR